MDVTSGAESSFVFGAIVGSAHDRGVVLVGAAVLVPFGAVVDLTPRSGHVAARVFAGVDQQPCGVAGGAGEHPLGASEVDWPGGGAEHDASPVSGEQRTQHIGRTQRDAGRGFAPSFVERGGIAEHLREQVRVGGEPGERVGRTPGEIGPVSQSGSSEDGAGGAVVDQHRHQGLGPDHLGRVGGSAARHGDQGVVAALRPGPPPGRCSTSRDGGVTRCDVVAVFGLFEPGEDLQELRRGEAVAAVAA